MRYPFGVRARCRAMGTCLKRAVRKCDVCFPNGPNAGVIPPQRFNFKASDRAGEHFSSYKREDEALRAVALLAIGAPT
jgi:hypothetical protein